MSRSLALQQFVMSIVEGGRMDAYAAYQKRGNPKYKRVSADITSETIWAHLKGTTPIACYFVLGESTKCAVIDLDDHDSSLDWSEMARIGVQLRDALIDAGMKVVPFRSGGGAGIHLWIFWSNPQPAKLVKRALRSIIVSAGFKIGTGGVQRREIEVFPKNDQVKEGSYGNAVAPPLSRKSVPLDENLNPIGLDDFEIPALSDLVSPSIEQIRSFDEPTLTQKVPTKAERKAGSTLSGAVLPGDEDQAREALKYVDSDDYDIWVRVALGLKNAFGPSGFDLWDPWAAKSSKYEGRDASLKVWEGLQPDGSVTIGTVFHLAQEGGWDGPSNKVVREYNEKFGVLTYGSTTRIILKNSESWTPALTALVCSAGVIHCL